ncbi:hypothetical protein FBR02_10460 [Anaerolineae bacterium CFX9]|nr:hypothetical protein [Anaerolineae bacterium CFX9]
MAGFYARVVVTVPVSRKGQRTIIPSIRLILMRLLHISALITFALIPVWYRLPDPIPLVTPLYVTRFLIVLPMAATILLWFACGLPGLRAVAKDRVRLLFTLALLLLALWGFASRGWAFANFRDPLVAQTAALQLGMIALFAVAVGSAGIAAQKTTAVLLITLIWTTALTLAQVGQQRFIGLQALGEFYFHRFGVGVSLLQAGDLAYVRPYGLLPHPNIHAGALMVALLGSSIWLLSDRRWLRWLAALIIPAGMLALLLTFSRAAWISIVIGALAALPFIRPLLTRRKAAALGAAALLTLAAGIFFAVQYRDFIVARTSGAESIEMRSVADRVVFIDFALRSISERPLLGVGIGNFPWRTSYYIAETFYQLRGDNVHHVLLSVTAELGIVGLALLLLALISGWAAGLRAVRRADGGERAARAGLLAISAALFAVGWLDHYPYSIVQMQTAWWGLLAVAGGLPSVSHRMDERSDQTLPSAAPDSR